jgi:hypothetical protein
MATIFDTIFSGSSGVGATLINLFGVNATFIHKESSEYNPRTDTYTEKKVEKSVKVSPLLKYSVYEMNTLGLTLEDSKVIGNGFDFPDVLNKEDMLRINGSNFVIIDHKVVYSGDNKAIITMQVRKQV